MWYGEAVVIIYSIYRALIPKGPKALYIIENNNKILNLQNYIIILYHSSMTANSENHFR